MTRPPTFTELLDWLEGRLDESAAADVGARAFEHKEAVNDDIAWIREFHSTTRLMPLEEPLASSGQAARSAFRRLNAPWSHDESDQMRIEFDSRLVPLAGVRSADSEAFRIEASRSGLALTLDVVPTSSDEVEFVGGVVLERGYVSQRESVVAVVLMADDVDQHTIPVDAVGTFRSMARATVDAVRVVTTLRALVLDLDDRPEER